MSATRSRLVILDRDGVINADSDAYIKSAEEWQPLPGSLDAIARLKAAGWRVAVATNQSGLARGLFDRAALDAMHQKFADLLAERGAAVDLIVWCPHGPDAGCDCRKPRPGLLHRIAEQLQIPLEGAVAIGDSLRDLEAAVAVGAEPWLVRTGKGERTLAKGGLPAGTRVYADLAAAVDALLRPEEVPA
ncbi:D-alpha,beta-D-heptose 1,7-bisphosphate phosphatase [Tibeticola sediminis]|uniref:D,D-heptose 1,7-bisphosphate phosphatase n=2 Tax=Tibeticola TaxID=1940136 RepID=A0A3N4V625_9BURK|nr:D-glycero-beta-D-manno-heptose 1,7-bisphosphate 7-phosphatase [Tibeticola sediminis]RPE72557.1 D-alpha,beta-D-heptose 1,7-bisphosphate phosphatase [Tibeticola sediminis]